MKHNVHGWIFAPLTSVWMFFQKKKKYQFGCMKYARKKKSPGLNGLNVSFQTIYA